MTSLVIQKRRRRLFQYLLIAPLDRTFSLAQIDDISMMVCKDLDLYMMGLLDVFFQIDGWIIKARFGFRLGEPERGDKILALPYEPQSFPSPARSRFEQHRKFECLSFFEECSLILYGLESSRYDGDSSLFHPNTRGCFFPHNLHRGRRRSNKNDVFFFAAADELGILCQKTVAGMNGLCPTLFSYRNDLIDMEVTF